MSPLRGARRRNVRISSVCYRRSWRTVIISLPSCQSALLHRETQFVIIRRWKAADDPSWVGCWALVFIRLSSRKWTSGACSFVSTIRRFVEIGKYRTISYIVCLIRRFPQLYNPKDGVLCAKPNLIRPKVFIETCVCVWVCQRRSLAVVGKSFCTRIATYKVDKTGRK